MAAVRGKDQADGQKSGDPFMNRLFGLALAMLVGLSGSVLRAAPPSPIPLPEAKVTIPPIVPLKLQSGGDLTVLDQVKKFEGVGGMPVMFVITPDDASDKPAPWSLISSVHVRMFNINGAANPDASEYLTSFRILKQTAYALDIPPSAPGQNRKLMVWMDEGKDGPLTQVKLEALYKLAGVSVDPLTSPSLDAPTLANFRQAATQPAAPKQIIFLAFHSNGADTDVLTTTRLRILMGVEFIKSPRTPVMELDEDRDAAFSAQLVPAQTSSSPTLIVYNFASNKVEAIYDPKKLPSLTEDRFQEFALQNGAPGFLNTRTDVAEAFVVITDHLRRHQ